MLKLKPLLVFLSVVALVFQVKEADAATLRVTGPTITSPNDNEVIFLPRGQNNVSVTAVGFANYVVKNVNDRNGPAINNLTVKQAGTISIFNQNNLTQPLGSIPIQTRTISFQANKPSDPIYIGPAKAPLTLGAGDYLARFSLALNPSSNTLGITTSNFPNLVAFGTSTLADENPFTIRPVPEPLTILGSGIALGFGALMERKYSRKRKKI